MERAWKTLLTLLAITAVSGSAFASTVASAPGRAEFQHLRWKGRTIKIDISSSLTRPNANIKYGSDVIGAIQRSIQVWQAAADIQILAEPSDKQSVSPSGLTGDGVSLITIAQTPENVLFFAKDSDSASAKTRIFFNRSGYITEADIVLNPFQQFSTDGTFGTFDLESTLTHEIGHLLGLRHSGVLGATMADSFARMGTFGIADFAPRTLAESDIAAIRGLYGPAHDTTDCCAEINGTLAGSAGKATRLLRVWAEEDRTGRVIGQTDSAADGTFSLNGLPAGNYSLFWKTADDASSPAIGQLGSVKVEVGETKTLAATISLNVEPITAQYVGLNSQIADFGLPLASGRSFIVYLGGRDLDTRTASIEFNSPYLSVMPGSLADQDFGGSVAVISFVVNVHPNTPPGEYSIFLTGESGLQACLIGGLSVK
jgi:hypothetical protein